MKWLKIILIIAALLIIVNLFLGYNIYRHYSAYTLLDEEAIKNTVSLLTESGISVKSEIIGNKKPNLMLYEFDFFTEPEIYYTNAALKISGEAVAENLTLHMINNGIKIYTSGGDNFEFYDTDIFSMLYIAKGKDEIVGQYDFEAIKNGDILQQSNENLDMYADIISSRLYNEESARIGEKVGFGIKINSAYKDIEHNCVVLFCTQTIANTEIYGLDAIYIIIGEELVYIKGSIIIMDKLAEYTPKLSDQLNILFAERTAHTGEDAEITSLSSIYTLSWNAAITKLYMIPSWRVVYMGDYAHIRNMINGELYIE